jgi:hypothetical protein
LPNEVERPSTKGFRFNPRGEFDVMRPVTSRASIGAAALVGVLGCRGPSFVGDSGAGGAGGSGAGGDGTGGGGGGSTHVTLSFEDASGTPIDGAAVVVSDPQGTPVGSASETGLDGTAVIDVPVGGAVTVLYEEPAGYFNAYSFAATASTTSARLIHSSDAPPPSTTPIDVDVSVSAPTVPTGSTIVFSLPCANSKNVTKSTTLVTTTFTNYVPCPGQASLTAYAMAIYTNGSLIGQSSKADVAPTDLSVTLPDISDVVDPVTLDLSATDVPSPADVFTELRVTVPEGRGLQLFFLDPAPLSQLEATFAPNLDILRGVFDSDASVNAFYYVHLADFTGMPSTFSAALAERVDPGTYDGDAITYSIGGGDVGDAISLRLRGDSARWSLFLPVASSGTVRVPALPSSLQGWIIPAAGAAVDTEHIDAVAASSYEDLLARGVAGDVQDTKDPSGVRWSTDAP